MDVFHVFYILQNATKSRKASHIKKLIRKSKAANLLFSLFANINRGSERLSDVFDVLGGSSYNWYYICILKILRGKTSTFLVLIC